MNDDGLTCFVCGFNFNRFYGKQGEGFIDIHHVKQLSEHNTAIPIDPAFDLVPLCANCHRMIHRNLKKNITLHDLKELIKKNT